MNRTKHISMNKQKKELEKAFSALASVSVARSALASGLGLSYGGDRDLYATLGYKKTLQFTDYWQAFTRGYIAKRIVSAYPDATWRGEPDVYENDKDNLTKFETAWDDLTKTINVWHYFTRVDKLAGVGRYAVLYIGFDDGLEASKPAERAKSILYLQPYSEYNAKIDTYETDPKNPRYGLPLMYKLTTSAVTETGVGQKGTSSLTGSISVHWSRVVHVAEDLMESNVFGTPRLEAVFNLLQSLYQVSGGAGEMFWRGAFPGMALEMEKNAQIADEDELNDELDEYTHNLRRILRLKGMKANQLNANIVGPKEAIDTFLMLVSGATGIPVRILTGSERGELASSQDKENWDSRVMERRKDFAEPVILRQFVDRLVSVGVLSAPAQENKVTVQWPEEDTTPEKEKSETAKNRTQALREYVEGGVQNIMPPKKYLTMVMEFDEDEADAILSEVSEMLDQEAEEAEEEEEQQKLIEEEAARLAAEQAQATTGQPPKVVPTPPPPAAPAKKKKVAIPK